MTQQIPCMARAALSRAAREGAEEAEERKLAEEFAARIAAAAEVDAARQIERKAAEGQAVHQKAEKLTTRQAAAEVKAGANMKADDKDRANLQIRDDHASEGVIPAKSGAGKKGKWKGADNGGKAKGKGNGK